jgi:hypothetical protein
MTVISAVFSTHCIAIASDSYLTAYNTSTKIYEILEKQKSKIIRVEKFFGAFSYWGLAAKSKNSKWKTYEWLNDMAKKAQNFDKLSLYAEFIKNHLSSEIKKIGIRKEDRGIGIHLVGYEEYRNGVRIPELFLITNYTDTTYSKTTNEIHSSRELFNTLPEKLKVGSENLSIDEKQLIVKDFLSKGNLLIFNNGDPTMFNQLSEGYNKTMKLAKKRQILKDSADIELYRMIARRPIEMVAKAQKDFYKEDKIIVGGRIHDLVIEKNSKKYSSTSGD